MESRPNPRPDITPAQWTAAAAWIVAQAVAFGWLSPGSGQLAVAVGSTVLGLGWQIADAVIRNGRSRHPVPPPPAPSSPEALGPLTRRLAGAAAQSEPPPTTEPPGAA